MTTSAGPLAGYRVAVTAERRREEIAAFLERRGADVVVAPAIRLVPLVDDAVLRERTQECLREPRDVVVVTTGIGFRGWMDAADAWGIGSELRESLAGARILSRGPKATGAIRSAGLKEEWTAPTESTDEVLARLVADGLRDGHVAIQLHGLPAGRLTETLRECGNDVIEVPVYRWDYPADVAPLDRVVGDIAAGRIDALLFTSALAVGAVLGRTRDLGLEADVLGALRLGRPLTCCVGTVTSSAFDDLDVPTLVPDRFRLGDLLRLVSTEVPARLDRPLAVGGHTLVLRREGYLLDGELVAVPETPMALLRELALRPGDVVSRARLLELLPEASNDNALESTVGRLRARLPLRGMIETVVKRGYRLAVDP